MIAYAFLHSLFLLFLWDKIIRFWSYGFYKTLGVQIGNLPTLVTLSIILLIKRLSRFKQGNNFMNANNHEKNEEI